ncbi:MAG: TfoX/Sxy family protein [Gammaproteobacteria bacterium]|nr:TfoX/Sxy family protein [Gammaproteobacteria bacterium]
MAYDEGLAQRLRECLDQFPCVDEKKMFGGLAFMVNGNMSVGIVKTRLIVRVGPDGYEQALTQPHAREMDFTGRPMTGFVYVDEQGFESDQDLEVWIGRALEFNKTLPLK